MSCSDTALKWIQVHDVCLSFCVVCMRFCMYMYMSSSIQGWLETTTQTNNTKRHKSIIAPTGTDQIVKILCMYWYFQQNRGRITVLILTSTVNSHSWGKFPYNCIGRVRGYKLGKKCAWICQGRKNIFAFYRAQDLQEQPERVRRYRQGPSLVIFRERTCSWVSFFGTTLIV